MYAYSNKGLSYRAVALNYEPVGDEVIFASVQDPATTDGNRNLTNAFDGFSSAYAASVQCASRKFLVSGAQSALDKSDVTVVRCYSANPQIAVPTAWTTYRSILRAIINGTDTTSTSLPAIPSYPAGT